MGFPCSTYPHKARNQAALAGNKAGIPSCSYIPANKWTVPYKTAHPACPIFFQFVKKAAGTRNLALFPIYQNIVLIIPLVDLRHKKMQIDHLRFPSAFSKTLYIPWSIRFLCRRNDTLPLPYHLVFQKIKHSTAASPHIVIESAFSPYTCSQHGGCLPPAALVPCC